MLKESAIQLSGNDRFEGFGIDLIHELSLLLGFNYTFRIQEDGVYGSLVNGQWNGMVKELLEHVCSNILIRSRESPSIVRISLPVFIAGRSGHYRPDNYVGA